MECLCTRQHVSGIEAKVKLSVCHVFRVGQNRIYALFMTVYMGVSLPNMPYIHRIYMYGSSNAARTEWVGFRFVFLGCWSCFITVSQHHI
jgi:hypothetical protein